MYSKLSSPGMKKLLLLISVTLLYSTLFAQECTNLGQTPATAFPVCGTSVFSQASVPICSGKAMPAPHCPGDGLRDKNPFYYKFNCFQTGTLGFLITPNSGVSDYDWELYDISGRDPNEIYTNGSIVVAANWSGEFGVTGASTSGTQLLVCAGLGKPLFSRMPTIQAGKEYLLMVSHFTNTQAGYALSFGGGTAVITDPNAPRLGAISPSCGGNILRLKLSKKIKCSSIASDGSDFVISAAGVVPIGAVGLGCNARFETDSIEIKLSQFLTSGNYTLSAKDGSDGNSLLDYCNVGIPATDLSSFNIAPIVPPLLDSIAPMRCAPSTIKMIFSKPVLCSSIANNGSDFQLNGPPGVSITAASGNCSGPITREITLTLSKAMEVGGNYSLQVQQGSDGNTLVDECGTSTSAGSNKAFIIKDTVNASFGFTVQYSCTEDVISFTHAGGNGVNSWKWNLDDGQQSNVQNPVARYTTFDQKDIQLIVSNGFCSDSIRGGIILDNFLSVDFTVAPDNCPIDPVKFTSNAVGQGLTHSWQFGDGGISSDTSPVHSFARPIGTITHKVRYSVTDAYGCTKTVEKPVNIYANCVVDIPSGFSPTVNGRNDYLYPLNAVKAEQLEFKIFNRWGQLMYSTTDWKKGWDGKYNGILQPAGTYVYTLVFIHRETKQKVSKKGTVQLIR